MKLALFSDIVLNAHEDKLKTFFDKPLKEVKFLYITTPTNYKPYQPDWSVESENRWRKIFPLIKRFDLQHAYEIDNSFDFKKYFESFDFVFVSGGNVFLLTYWMRETGSLEILKELIRNDKVVYGGESAGSIFVYKDMSLYAELDNPDKAPARVDEGLTLVDFAPLPHWESKDFGEGLKKIKLSFEKSKIKTYTLTDRQALFYNKKEINII